MRRWGDFAAFLALFGVILALWIWKGGQSAAFLFVGMAVLLMAALGSALLPLRGVYAESRVEASRLYAGETTRVTLRIRHRSYWPVMWLVVRETWQHTGGDIVEFRQLLFPWFRSEMTLQYELRDLPRGQYRSIGVELYTGDLFGLAQTRRNKAGQASFLVYPKPMNIEALLRSGSDDEGSTGGQAVLWQESGVLRSVRPYEAGDPLQRIHWKLTARTGSLKTKTFEPVSSKRITVCVDTSSSSYEGLGGRAVFESAVRAAAGMVRQSLAGGSSWTQLRSSVNGDVGVTITSVEAIRLAYEWLARLRPDSRASYADYMGEAALRLSPQQTLVCITPQADRALLLALRRLMGAGRACTVLLVHAAPALSWAHRDWKHELLNLGCGFGEVQARAEAGAKSSPLVTFVEGGSVDGIA